MYARGLVAVSCSLLWPSLLSLVDYRKDKVEMCSVFQPLNEIFLKHAAKTKVKEMNNKMWSHLSSFMALSTLYKATGGKSREQVGKVLAGTTDPDKIIDEVYNWLAEVYSKDLDLIIANKVLTKYYAKKKFNETFIKEGKFNDKMKVSINSINKGRAMFGKKKLTEKVNQWASNVTNGMIKEVMTEKNNNVDTTLLIINLIYFKGKWKHPFPKENTKKSLFYTNSGPKEVDMMVLKASLDVGVDNEKVYTRLTLPYSDDQFAMFAYLPKMEDSQTVEDVKDRLFKKNLCAEFLQSPTEVHVHFPKFDLSKDFKFTKVLKKAGAKDIFNTKKANFSRLLKDESKKIAITDISQIIKITVDEVGTKAAAATTIEGEEERSVEEPYVLKFDRPFMFNIVHLPTKLPIFGGYIVDPSPKEDKKAKVSSTEESKDIEIKEEDEDAGSVDIVLDGKIYKNNK